MHAVDSMVVGMIWWRRARIEKQFYRAFYQTFRQWYGMVCRQTLFQQAGVRLGVFTYGAERVMAPGSHGTIVGAKHVLHQKPRINSAIASTTAFADNVVSTLTDLATSSLSVNDNFDVSDNVTKKPNKADNTDYDTGDTVANDTTEC
ncbi:hypothetical protein PHYBLDRAFT_141528 [Phycomyces blakesleeanus NRRL 1555(-)]|uniref:Uncharacterized protein n=1 Tax=Phycomyces blakesleeanus (strain ATCC 8743b / DSM 1359 / FGSC 10004 / NBRC 33097 / NRRL 1555) TaxID=763407 RepID=A0A167PCE5_PHYB8|nr:hypothetical protein PHYBLDRAFT_141528 [Phycomyces blakesleeanus NRRL 1555(-)]OAD77658.1 hypothetical protein PHYBLDRAFT_141528 [Phycomyces blakesleeanus NRRL 1555(-)]|eukprot:XP_018295698.1 hypothetical protein PHYBLDRAFT_141528 [Phycomyces blakesleeanus NRRL 1555(-)]